MNKCLQKHLQLLSFLVLILLRSTLSEASYPEYFEDLLDEVCAFSYIMLFLFLL